MTIREHFLTIENRFYHYAATGFPVGYWPTQYKQDKAYLDKNWPAQSKQDTPYIKKT